MDFAGRQALRCVVAVAILKAATVEHIVEGRGQEITVVAVAITNEEIIFFADGVVPANVKLVLRFAAFWIGQEVAGGLQSANGGIGRGNRFASSWASGSIGVLVPPGLLNLFVGVPV